MTQIGLFLGAGASKCLGLPLSNELTDHLSTFINIDHMPFLSEIIKPDVEETLQIFETCIKNGDALLNAHTMFTLFNRFYVNNQKKNTGVGLTAVIDHLKSSNHNVLIELNKMINDHGKDNKLDFHFYKQLFDFLLIIQNHTNVFTTNYDNGIKKFTNEHITRITYNEGIDQTSNYSKILTPNAVAKNFRDGKHRIDLYRLHGSLSWKLNENDDAYQITDKNDAQNFKVAVPPILGKTIKGIHTLEKIHKEFELKVMEDDILVIIGYSFRDMNINKVIKKRLENEKNVIIISPRLLSEVSPNLFGDKVETLSDDAIRDKSLTYENKYPNLKLIPLEFNGDSVLEIINYIKKFNAIQYKS